MIAPIGVEVKRGESKVMEEDFSIGLLTAFGLESVVRDELAGLGIRCESVRNGRVTFRGGWREVALCNLALRTCDRVVLPLAEFPASTFDELYEGARAVTFAFPGNAHIMVSGKSVRSRLSAFEVCASVAKKALIDRTLSRCGGTSLSSEIPYRLTISLRNDVAELYLDTSGKGLSFRGYRKLNGEAAIRETLAAALVLLSGWKGDTPFSDPFCGTGTIPIEAAMIARRMAPNLRREFDFEAWKVFDCGELREQLRGQILPHSPDIFGSDIDPNAISMAGYHAGRAGVRIGLRVADVRDAVFPSGGTVVTNPPYGERISDRKEAANLLAVLARRCREAEKCNLSVITPERNFERLSGLSCRRRKLYNGGIECTYFQHFAQKSRLPF